MNGDGESAGAPGLPSRILLVEDDAELRDAILIPGLVESGFSVVGAGNAAELYRAMLSNTFDIVVLDVGLPDESGFDVARHLRSISSVGIVMLTARDSDPDRVRGLGVGADAYLAKPIDMALLVATLSSLARRLAMEPAQKPGALWRLTADAWHLLTPENHSIELTPTERIILRRLFTAPGRPVERDVLIADLVEDVSDFDPHRLEMYVHRLRRKIASVTPTELPLRAVRGKGYLLVPMDGRSVPRDH